MTTLRCRGCGESPMREGIVTIRDGKPDEPSALCKSCIHADADDRDGGTAVAESPDTFDAFIAEADAAVATWLDTLPPEAWANRDMRMAAAFGELRALFQLYEIWREAEGDPSFSRVFDAYVGVMDEFARRRNSLDFTGLLKRHRDRLDAEDGRNS